MSYNTVKPQHKTSNDISGWIFIALIVTGIIVWIVISSLNTTPLASSRPESYKILISRWLQKSNPSLSETKRNSVAACVYDSDPNILTYRSQLKQQQDRKNEGHMIISVNAILDIDFLKSLDEYTSGETGGFKGLLLDEEKSRIERAIKGCL